MSKLDLQGIVFAGKGGVGKSNSAGCYAVHRAEHGRIAIFDHDGGHSASRVLFGNDNKLPTNQLLETSINDLWLSILDPLKFVNVSDWKKKPRGDLSRNIDHYFMQFEGDQGYVAWNDMIMNFFGPACDISSISKFCYLTSKLYEAQEKGLNEIVVDVEPTEGLKNLLNCGSAAARSLRNLQEVGIGPLMVLRVAWPDITAFLGGDYISEADFYATRLEQTVSFLQKARYYVVTLPESSPVSQSFEVKSIIQGYGASVHGYVINNVRGEKHEQSQIARVKSVMSSLPLVIINHDEKLCDSDGIERRAALLDVGRRLAVFDMK